MTRFIDVSLQLKFKIEEKKVYQEFIVIDKKRKKYLLNNRYILNKTLEEFISKNALSLFNNNYIFISRKENEDRITLEFEVKELNKMGNEVSNRFFTLVGEIPFSSGCEECKFLRGETYCEKKEKELGRRQKTCAFFSQKSREE